MRFVVVCCVQQDYAYYEIKHTPLRARRISAPLAECPVKHVKYTSGGGITVGDCSTAVAAAGAVNAV